MGMFFDELFLKYNSAKDYFYAIYPSCSGYNNLAGKEYIFPFKNENDFKDEKIADNYLLTKFYMVEKTLTNI